jgi:hypothetical protein
MNMPDRPKRWERWWRDFHDTYADEANLYMDALEAKVAALEAQIAQAYNDGVEAAALVTESPAPGLCYRRLLEIREAPKTIRQLKRPVVEAQKEQE